MRKAIFLDRDGTINFNAEYISKPSKVTLLNNAVEGLRILQRLGFMLIIVTNQSGIARGYFTEKDLEKVNDRLLTLLIREGILIDDIFFCPYHKEGSVKKYRKESEDRKPAPGMILKAAKKHNIDLSQSYMIGDSKGDIQAGKKAGCAATIFIDPDHREDVHESQDFNAKDLLESAVWIKLKEQEKKLVPQDILPSLVKNLRKNGKRVVFTNGVFDVIHPGHINYLSLCKETGDYLIIGLNSDASVKRNKGDKRPVNDLASRIDMIASLDSVDYITVFDENDPSNLIRIIKPDIHIKDDHYTVEQIIEYDDVIKNGGKVVQLPRIKDYSTTKMIEKIKEKF